MLTYLCWCPDDGTEDDAKEVKTFDAQSAAEEFAEKRFYGADYPEFQEISVKDPDGNVECFSVQMEPQARKGASWLSRWTR